MEQLLSIVLAMFFNPVLNHGRMSAQPPGRRLLKYVPTSAGGIAVNIAVLSL